MANTFLWYDYETFGTNFSYDMPVQFGYARTDMDLNILDEGLFYCQLSGDYVPNPEAVLVTGITPQIAMQKGMLEAEFAKKIHELMSTPNTCIVGYNSIRFDDHITRHLFYRNFYDPYAHEYANHNSRWDLLDVMRTAYALRPNGINWPKKEDNLTPSFKLEDLTRVNNIEENANAHDALADARATIKMARLLKSNQPLLFDYLFKYRNKKVVATQLEVGKPILHISGRYSPQNGCAALVVPLTQIIDNVCIVFNLNQDPNVILDLTQDEISDRIFTSKTELEENNLIRPELKQLWINRAPIVLPVNSLTKDIAARLNIDIDACENNFKKLKPAITTELSNKIIQAFNHSFEPAFSDSSMQLYSGNFFNNADKKRINQVNQTPLEDLANYNFSFDDERLNDLLFLYKAKNAPNLLTNTEQKLWLKHCQTRITNENMPFNLAKAEAEFLRLMQTADRHKVALLEEYKIYLESIIPYY